MAASATPCAVLADIHGNRWALDVVLAHARSRCASRFYDAGDTAYGPLDPRGTLERLISLPEPLIRVNGNGDRPLWENSDLPPTMAWTRSQLGADQIAWLRAAPGLHSADGVTLFHGQPRDDTRYLREKIENGRVTLRPALEVETLTGDLADPLLICGHSHLPGLTALTAGRLLLNPGSVGLPAYDDDEPEAHASESGSPHARYALVWPGERGWTVELVCLPYDHEAAARAAERAGRSDWAHSLRTGRV